VILARGEAQTGAVTFVQRFGSALNLQVHFHAPAPECVFVEDREALRSASCRLGAEGRSDKRHYAEAYV
jgi:hypothetical protein